MQGCDNQIIEFTNTKKITRKFKPKNHHFCMRSKIRYDLLLQSQKYANKFHHPVQKVMYETAYKNIMEMRSDVLKPFKNICIHGSFPQLIIPALKEKEKGECRFWVHSHLGGSGLEGVKVEAMDAGTPFNASKHEEKFDLIISCLEAHHYETNRLMENYLAKLNPDGAVIGCCWAQNTLKQLRWSYLMAQNQRSGGISPRVMGFPSIGDIGHSMTTSQMKMPTIVVHDFVIEVDSVVDVLTLVQAVGQSGTLQGRRKGVYKDVLLAACAYYDAQFWQQKKGEKNRSVSFSLEMCQFIGWKQHESQPKPLSRKQVVNNSLFVQIMKEDPTSKLYKITEGEDQPEEIDPSSLSSKQKQKDPKE